VKLLIKYGPNVVLQGEVLEEWKQDLQKLYRPYERNKKRNENM